MKLAFPSRVIDPAVVATLRMQASSNEDYKLLEIMEYCKQGQWTPAIIQRIQTGVRTTAMMSTIKSESLLDMTKTLTVGFELETQETNGVNRDTIGRAVTEYNSKLEPDLPAQRVAIRHSYKQFLKEGIPVLELKKETAVHELLFSILFDNWIAEVPSINKEEAAAVTKTEFTKILSKQGVDQWSQALASQLPNGRISLEKIGTVAPEFITKWRREVLMKAKKLHPKEKYVKNQLSTDGYMQRKLLKCPEKDRKLFHVGFDGSVRGFEIRTAGALRLPEFIRATTALFGRNQHVIDNGCSFHLHVGIKNISQPYSPTVQWYIYEYLMDHIHEVPESVLERWRSSVADRYFRPHISPDKYSFVHGHRQGTWEFRCFGNVHNKRDALRCLLLATRALVYAYEVSAGTKKPILEKSNLTLMKECITSGTRLSKLAAKGAR